MSDLFKFKSHKEQSVDPKKVSYACLDHEFADNNFIHIVVEGVSIYVGYGVKGAECIHDYHDLIASIEDHK